MAAPRKTSASTTTTKIATVTVAGKEYTMAGSNAFVIPEDEVKEIISRGRKAKESIYHNDVAEAAKHRGKMFGIRPAKDQKVTTVLSQLRAAAKAQGVKLSIHDRTESKGYVGFVVLPDVPTETAS